MADGTEIAKQFSALPMSSLIGGPLQAACDAQLQLANATVNFIKTVGMEEDGVSARTAQFAYERIKEDGSIEKMNIQAPLLSIVKIPSLAINTLDITFDMEVKTAEETKSSDDKKVETEASAGFHLFGAKISIKGSVSSHKENTRKTDTSAKYHVELHARDDGMSEGLSRVLDFMQSSIQPQAQKIDESKKQDEKNK